jgi:hypothetical protein
MPNLNIYDEIMEFMGKRGYTHQATLDSGVALTLQLFRAWLVGQGSGARFIPPSASLFGKKPVQNPTSK